MVERSAAPGADIHDFAAFRPTVDPRESLSGFPKSNADLVRRVLAGSWRRDAGCADLSRSEVAQVSTLLVQSGGAALGWRRLKALAGAEDAVELRGVAQRLVFSEVMRVQSLTQVLALLNGAGVTPLLIKGWALGQLYAEPWLRPYGDVDLVVRPEDLKTTREVLARHALPGASNIARDNFAVDCEPKDRLHHVDLHERLAPYYDLPVDVLFRHARPVRLAEGGELLVPAPEHHLRIVILHLLKHGAWKPLWLCDVAAVVESADADFDWSLALPDSAVMRGWMAVTIGAAHRLLDCRVDHLPVRVWTPAPAWLTDAILREWRAPFAFRFMSYRGAALRNPRHWLAVNWPNRIKSAFRRGVSPSRPHAPFQQLNSFIIDQIRPLAGRALSRDWWRHLRPAPGAEA